MCVSVFKGHKIDCITDYLSFIYICLFCVCVCLNIFACIYIYICVCVCVCLCTYVHICLFMCMCVRDAKLHPWLRRSFSISNVILFDFVCLLVCFFGFLVGLFLFLFCFFVSFFLLISVLRNTYFYDCNWRKWSFIAYFQFHNYSEAYLLFFYFFLLLSLFSCDYWQFVKSGDGRYNVTFSFCWRTNCSNVRCD